MQERRRGWRKVIMQPVCHQRTCTSIAGYMLLKGHLGRELQREQAERWQIASPLARADRKKRKKKKKAAKAKLREIKAIYTASARCSGDQLSADKQSFLQTETLGSQISMQQDDRLTRAGIRILLLFFFYLPRLRCHKDTILSYSHLCSRGKVI